jgi:hypothetical protein
MAAGRSPALARAAARRGCCGSCPVAGLLHWIPPHPRWRLARCLGGHRTAGLLMRMAVGPEGAAGRPRLQEAGQRVLPQRFLHCCRLAGLRRHLAAASSRPARRWMAAARWRSAGRWHRPGGAGAAEGRRPWPQQGMRRPGRTQAGTRPACSARGGQVGRKQGVALQSAYVRALDESGPTPSLLPSRAPHPTRASTHLAAGSTLTARRRQPASSSRPPASKKAGAASGCAQNSSGLRGSASSCQ